MWEDEGMGWDDGMGWVGWMGGMDGMGWDGVIVSTEGSFDEGRDGDLKFEMGSLRYVHTCVLLCSHDYMYPD